MDYKKIYNIFSTTRKMPTSPISSTKGIFQIIESVFFFRAYLAIQTPKNVKVASLLMKRQQQKI